MLAEPRIVCAANRSSDGLLAIGARHYDALMRRQIDQYRAAHLWNEDHSEDSQGFIDQFGKYYPRAEAWKIAEAAGQILHRCGGDTRDGGTLFSENLY